MNIAQLRQKDTSALSAVEQAKIDLAAAHRLAVMHGFNEGIFNHFTLAVPETNDRYYQIPFGMHWSEVSASSFMEVGYDGQLLKGSGEVERSGYCIHAPIHEALPHAACVLHTHMPYASALARLEDMSILPIGQTELMIMRQTTYDYDYAGPAFDPAEGRRLVDLLGEKSIMMMANHGVLTVGRTVAEAYDRLYYLERVAQVQLYAMWSGRPLHYLSDETVEASVNAFKTDAPAYEKAPSEYHFAALKRILDRKEPDYRD